MFCRLFCTVHTGGDQRTTRGAKFTMFTIRQDQTKGGALFVVGGHTGRDHSHQDGTMLHALLTKVDRPSTFGDTFLCFLFVGPRLQVAFRFQRELTMGDCLQPKGGLKVSILSGRRHHGTTKVGTHLLQCHIGRAKEVRGYPHARSVPLQRTTLANSRVHRRIAKVHSACGGSIGSNNRSLQSVVNRLFRAIFRFPITTTKDTGHSVTRDIRSSITILRSHVVKHLMGGVVQRMRGHVVRVLCLTYRFTFFRVARGRFVNGPRRSRVGHCVNACVSCSSGACRSLLGHRGTPSVPSA